MVMRVQFFPIISITRLLFSLHILLPYTQSEICEPPTRTLLSACLDNCCVLSKNTFSLASTQKYVQNS